VSTLVSDGILLTQPLPPSTTVASHYIEPHPPIDSHVAVKTPSSLEVPSPSLAQMAMEPHSNIPTPPSAKILHLVPIDVPTPTPIEVSKPQLVEVLVQPSIQAPAVPIHKIFTKVPPIFTIVDVCREVKESSKTLPQKSSKSIMQVNKDVKLQQLYVSLW
jgi:hypothetical protein